jgi:hypothetical protein
MRLSEAQEKELRCGLLAMSHLRGLSRQEFRFGEFTASPVARRHTPRSDAGSGFERCQSDRLRVRPRNGPSPKARKRRDPGLSTALSHPGGRRFESG